MDKSFTLLIILIGSEQDFYKANSLFDPEAEENTGRKKLYNISWDYHTSHNTEAVLLEKTPAIAFDYLYELSFPDDMNSDQISEMGSDYEYTNATLRTLLRFVVGPLRFKICAGFVHRISSLKAASSAYDYAPYFTPKTAPLRSELHPPSEDDYDALNANIPLSVVQYTFISPVIEIYLFDHSFFEPTKENLFRKHKVSISITFKINPLEFYF